MKASNVDTRHAGTLARQKLLMQALRGEHDVPSKFLAACKSQSTFAALSLPSRGVEPLALNTLKASAEICIEGTDGRGWQHLDNLRRQLLQSRKATRKPSSSPAPQKTDGDGIAQLELERRFRVRLEVAYTDLLKKVAAAAVTDTRWAEVLQRHQAGFSLQRLKLVAGERSED